MSKSIKAQILEPIAMIGLVIGGFIAWEYWPAKETPQMRQQRHIKEAESKTKDALNKRVSEIRDLFNRSRAGAPRFAEEVLSWGGKWVLVKDKIRGGENGEHARFLAESFKKHVLDGEELNAALQRAVEGYLKDLDAIENNLLVQLRADLDESQLGRETKPAFLNSDAAFADEYRRLAANLRKALVNDIGVTVGREVVSFVAMDVATQVVLSIAQTAAAELGVDTAILGSGAAAGVATLGVGLVVGLAVDQVISWAMKEFGYDPEKAIAEKVQQSLSEMERVMIDGASGKSGLKRELEKLRRARSRVQSAVLEKLVKEGGQQ